MKTSVLDFIDSDTLREHLKDQTLEPAIECILIAHSLKCSIEKKLEALKERYDTYSEEDFNKTFVVTKITTKSVTLNDKPNTEVTVEAVEKGTKKKIKFKGYEEVSVKVNWIGSVKKWPLIGEMPIVLVDALSEYKAENVGKTILLLKINTQ